VSGIAKETFVADDKTRELIKVHSTDLPANLFFPQEDFAVKSPLNLNQFSHEITEKQLGMGEKCRFS
jgi:hypothetical protein